MLGEVAGSRWDVQRFRGFFKVVNDSEKLEITALEMLPLHLHHSALFMETRYRPGARQVPQLQP